MDHCHSLKLSIMTEVNVEQTLFIMLVLVVVVVTLAVVRFNTYLRMQRMIVTRT